ncbi:uncharacterized protein LOC8286483 [Ricinus communis]|uniref:Uncharacterized protein n=1 Tax=Ricinus communis TaxID=3988 RepID=B9SI56_RICCO|nr:uncharacterized protein LOC8286483 [Ricinus communis]EEF36658.1 conserved hypothetical protein [Ricinus communis]|eukprot:XP_002525675.1 uncharacterized protein LOC8286483 [Ricinus communis]
MVQRTAAVGLLLFFLGFSFLLSSLAVPTTRSLKSTEDNPSSSVQDFLIHQEGMDLSSQGEELDFIIAGRMDLESTDYPGTGANNHHDPKTPGRL